MHGQGTLEWPNGDRCTGDWEHNRACGRAKLVTHSGIAYEGQVQVPPLSLRLPLPKSLWMVILFNFESFYLLFPQDSLPHGSGTLTMGHMYYMGVFEYGERQGTGIMDYGNGLKYEVFFFSFPFLSFPFPPPLLLFLFFISNYFSGQLGC